LFVIALVEIFRSPERVPRFCICQLAAEPESFGFNAGILIRSVVGFVAPTWRSKVPAAKVFAVVVSTSWNNEYTPAPRNNPIQATIKILKSNFFFIQSP
jgi:hypothetical protein